MPYTLHELDSINALDSVFSLHSTLGLPVTLSCAEHPESRPLCGVQSLEQGGRSALRNDCARSGKARLSPPRLRKKTQRVASAAQQKSGALSFSGLGRAETPFSFAQTSDFENLGNIREKENLRG